jgi:biopolymer transport protein ExbD
MLTKGMELVILAVGDVRLRHSAGVDSLESPERQPMRKLVLASLTMVLTVGLTLAGEVVFVKFDAEKKALTVKEGETVATYTITDDTKVKRGDKDAKLENVVKYFSEKAKEGAKFEITVNKDKKTLTEIKLPGKK